MEKRTTIYLDDDDREAIDVMKEEYKSRGVTLTASAAIRLALREASQRIKQASKLRNKSDR